MIFYSYGVNKAYETRTSRYEFFFFIISSRIQSAGWWSADELAEGNATWSGTQNPTVGTHRVRQVVGFYTLSTQYVRVYLFYLYVIHS